MWTTLDYASVPKSEIIWISGLCISQFQAWPSPSGNFFDGQIPHPPGKKRVQNPTPRAYKNKLKPHPGDIFLNCSL